MKYTATVRRNNGTDTTYISVIETNDGEAKAVELAKTLVASYSGHELVGLKDADGKEIDFNGQ